MIESKPQYEIKNLMNDFLADYQNLNTNANYVSTMKQFINFLEKNHAVKDSRHLKKSHIKGFLRTLQLSVEKSEIKLSTKDAKVYCVFSFIDFLNKTILSDDPIAKPTYRKSNESTKTYILSDNEINKISNCINILNFSRFEMLNIVFRLMI